MIRIRSQYGSTDFCITSSILHVYGYGTVLATLQKICTTDGRIPRSTKRFYNGFGVDSMYMTTDRRHGGSAFPEIRGTD